MRFIFVVIAVLMTSTAWADVKGTVLNEACNSASGSIGDKLCQAYINGFIDGMLGDQFENQHSTPICLPEHMDTGEIRVIMTQYFATHSPALPFDAGSSATVALEQAYPCKKPN